MYAILRQKPPSRNETYVLVFMLLSPISLYENNLQIILFFSKSNPQHMPPSPSVHMYGILTIENNINFNHKVAKYGTRL